MGMCLPCMSGEKDDYQQPSPATRRRQQAEAAAKRQEEAEARGVKDPASVKRKLQRREELEARADVPNSEGGMRWQVG